MFFKKTRRQKLVETYQKLGKEGESYIDAEEVLKRYPDLELYEAVLISGYLERGVSPKEFGKVLEKLGIK